MDAFLQSYLGNEGLLGGAVLAFAQEPSLGLGQILIFSLYLITLFFILLFGFHRWQLVWLYYKNRKNIPRCRCCFLDLPPVTVQLPMFNEPYVARRIIAATCAIDYPKDKLQIQVLDDSTDQTCQIASAAVAHFSSLGYDIQYLHRSHRHGFKAGALKEGLKSATGQFVAVYDADFVPRPDNLKDAIHYFTDDKVAMVQLRWEHINRDHSLLTRIQAIYLDAHFMIEHTARNRSGRFMNFNGTAGIWRRLAIEDAGSWQHDTLTEDLDLSYRCQMKGWKFVYLPHVTAPAELPPEIQGFKQQQFRWTKGAIQTAKKILPAIVRSNLPFAVKLEAFFHLTNPMAYLFMSLMVLILMPVSCIRFSLDANDSFSPVFWGIVVFFLASCSASAFYMSSQREIFHRWWDKLIYLPLLMGVGVGMAINNSLAVIEALWGKESAFERTPKFGVSAEDGKDDWIPKAQSFVRKNTLLPLIELAYGFYVSVCAVMYLYQDPLWLMVFPFLIIFAFGYFYVAFLTLFGNRVSTLKAPEDLPEVLESSAA